MKILRLFTVSLFISICMLGSADNWMRRLPDNAYVSTLSIPGSHDSATGHGFSGALASFGKTYAQTQDLSIQEQWELGIRAFDFRPAVYDNYININHGIMPTKLHFDTALYTLVDYLKANPSEFVIIHMLHDGEGDDVKNVYEERILELLNRADLRNYLADFKKDLKVKDLRGKILILSRNEYAETPIGGFFINWSGSEDWYWQTRGQIKGATSTATATLYMQDYSDTHNSGGVETKVNAINTMLDFSTAHQTKSVSDIVWVFNLASAYSKVSKIPIVGTEASTSDGYRDNATYTHAAILDYLARKSGPTGVILMDYAGVDWSGSYNTRGKEMIDAIIANNFKYLGDLATIGESDATTKKPVDFTPYIANPRFNANNLTSGWTGDTFGAVGGAENAEHYNRNYNTWQTVTGIPNGVYAVGVKAFYRAGMPAESFKHYRMKDAQSRYARLYAIAGQDTTVQAIVSPFSAKNGRKRNVGDEVYISGGGQTNYIPNNMVAAEYYMHTMNKYANTVFVAVDNNTLTMGVRKDQTIGGDWTLFDDFSLTYYGNQTDAYQYCLDQLQKNAESYSGITATAAYVQAYTNSLTAKATNKQELTAAIKAINGALDDLALNVTLWADYQAIANECLASVMDESVPEQKRTALSAYLDQHFTPNMQALVLTNSELKAEIAYAEDLLSKTATDITDGYLANADFTWGDTSWNKAEDTRPGLAFSENIAEAYDTDFDLYQEVTVTQPGVYELSAKGFFRLERGGDAWTKQVNGEQVAEVFLYINDEMIMLNSIFNEPLPANSQQAAQRTGSWMADVDPGNLYPDDMASAAYAFSTGMYPNKVSYLVTNADGETLRIGIRGKMTGANWACFDDFRLSYRASATLGIQQPEAIQHPESAASSVYYDLQGKQLAAPHGHGIFIQKDARGRVKKVINARTTNQPCIMTVDNQP